MKTQIASDGGSSEYYQLDLRDGRRVECLDVLEALGLDFAEGNILKALWRRSAWRRGVGKRGTPPHYDARKIVFFANRLLAQAGEAGTAETTKIGSVHEHAVPEGDAPRGRAD